MPDFSEMISMRFSCVLGCDQPLDLPECGDRESQLLKVARPGRAREIVADDIRRQPLEVRVSSAHRYERAASDLFTAGITSSRPGFSRFVAG